MLILAAASCTLANDSEDPLRSISSLDTSSMEPQVRQLIEHTITVVREDMESAKVWGELGQVLHAHELSHAAVASYDQASVRNPEDYRWPYLAAHAQQHTDPTAALQYFRRALDISDEEPTVYIAFGDALQRSGRHDEAMDQFQRALALNPRSSFAYLGIARSHIARRSTEIALQVLEKAVESGLENPAMYGLMSTLYSQQDETDSASRYRLLAMANRTSIRQADPVIQAMESHAVNAASLAEKAQRLARQGQLEEAESLMRRVLEIRPGTVLDFGNLGSVLSQQERYGEALRYLNQGLAIEPNSPHLLSVIGLTQMRIGQLEDARTSLVRATTLPELHAPAWLNLGILELAEGNLNAAAGAFERAISIDRFFDDAYQNLGSTLAHLNDFDRAIEVWNDLLRFRPNRADTLFSIGFAYSRQGDLVESADALARAYRIGTSPPSQALLAANTVRQLVSLSSESEDAKRSGLNLAVALASRFPRNPQILEALAIAYAHNGDLESASSTVDRALMLARSAPNVTDSLHALKEKIREMEH